MTFKAESFLTYSLREHPEGLKTARVLAAALSAVDPAYLIRENVHRIGNILQIKDKMIDLEDYQRIFLLGIGKAALPMSLAAAELLDGLITKGWLLTKPGGRSLPEKYRGILTLYFGGHPLPDQSSLRGTEAILGEISNLSEHDLVIILLSGGGSALFTLPAPGLNLADLVRTNQLLLESGADIHEVNTIRKHLSAVKGGRLAQAIHPGKALTLILSDVPGNQLDSIASGPTAPDPTTFQDAIAVVERYDLRNRLPRPVLDHLEKGLQGQVLDTPKSGDPCFIDQLTHLIGSNQDACQAAVRQAAAEGFHSLVLSRPLVGEARIAGQEFAGLLHELVLSGKPLPRPACLIAGGETTVTLTDTPSPGKGGRNLELALSAVGKIAGLENCALITLATDGEDGVTDAAGAVVTGESLSRASQRDQDPADFLSGHNAYPFFASLNDLLLPGPSGTNVNDLCFLFTFQ